MTVDLIEVQCDECRERIEESPHLADEDRLPCPRCGSRSRYIRVAVSGTLVTHSKLALKGQRLGLKKPFIEQVVGDDLYRKTGRWMKLERVIDRLKNWYHERVTDPSTGTVVHECDQPLSDHQGHGSNRKK